MRSRVTMMLIILCADSRSRPALELYADSTLAQESKDYLDSLFDTLHKSRALGNGVKVLQVCSIHHGSPYSFLSEVLMSLCALTGPPGHP